MSNKAQEELRGEIPVVFWDSQPLNEELLEKLYHEFASDRAHTEQERDSFKRYMRSFARQTLRPFLPASANGLRLEDDPGQIIASILMNSYLDISLSIISEIVKLVRPYLRTPVPVSVVERVAWAITNADIEFKSTANIPHWGRHLAKAALSAMQTLNTSGEYAQKTENIEHVDTVADDVVETLAKWNWDDQCELLVKAGRKNQYRWVELREETRESYRAWAKRGLAALPNDTALIRQLVEALKASMSDDEYPDIHAQSVAALSAGQARLQQLKEK